MEIMTLNESNGLYKNIRWYNIYNLNLIPIKEGTKRPFVSWKDYQKRRSTEKEMFNWFSRQNIKDLGIVCGSISGNFFVLDSDDKEFSLALEKKLPSTTIVQSSPGRFHFYFKSLQQVPTKHYRWISKLSKTVVLDILGESSIVVCPPSRHPLGHLYKFRTKEGIPKISFDAIKAKIHEVIQDLGYISQKRG